MELAASWDSELTVTASVQAEVEQDLARYQL